MTVSSLCLGTMTFGQPSEKSFMHKVGCDEATSFAIMERALDGGVAFWDTADIYGDDGMSERIIGNWFDRTGRRDEIALATKFRFRMSPGANGAGASRYRIIKACEDSLRRLKTDRIDLYQIHMQDLNTPEEETLRALDDLVRQGKVLYTGCSNYTAWRLCDSMWLSETRGWEHFVTLQAQYSLVVRTLEREHIGTCQRHGLGILAWSPLASGFLSGKYKKDQPPPDGTRLAKWEQSLQRYDNERNWRILAAVEAVAAELGTTCAQVSLAWLLRKPCMTSVIFGARDVEQVDDNIAAAKLALSDEQVAALDAASEFELGYPYDFIRMVEGH